MISAVQPQFVESIPKDLVPGVLYISIKYGTVVHSCCCECGSRTVTPLGRTDWQLIFDGESVSLYPSVGNWSFECESHYWIVQNRVVPGGRMSKQRIEAGREANKRAKKALEQGEPIGTQTTFNLFEMLSRMGFEPTKKDELDSERAGQ